MSRGIDPFWVRMSSKLFDPPTRDLPVVAFHDIPYVENEGRDAYKHVLDIFIPLKKAEQIDELPQQVPPHREKGAPNFEIPSAVPNCRKCNKQFGIFTRQYHCNRCGKIFCFECSDYYTELPKEWGLDGPRRCCKHCFGFTSIDHLPSARWSSTSLNNLRTKESTESTDSLDAKDRTEFLDSLPMKASFAGLTATDASAEYSKEDLLPVFVFIHGGGWREGDKHYYFDAYSKVGRYMACNNFVAVVVNYRLAPKYKHPHQIEDCAAALRWVYDKIDKYGGDPNKVFLAGHSAGAHLAMLLMADSRYLAAVNLHPYIPRNTKNSSDHQLMANHPHDDQTNNVEPLSTLLSDIMDNIDSIAAPSSEFDLAQRVDHVNSSSSLAAQDPTSSPNREKRKKMHNKEDFMLSCPDSSLSCPLSRDSLGGMAKPMQNFDISSLASSDYIAQFQKKGVTSSPYRDYEALVLEKENALMEQAFHSSSNEDGVEECKGFIKGLIPISGPYDLLRFNKYPFLRSYLITPAFTNWAEVIKTACPAYYFEQDLPIESQIPLPPTFMINAEYDWGMESDSKALMEILEKKRNHKCIHKTYPGTNHISIMSDFWTRKTITNLQPHMPMMKDIVTFLKALLNKQDPRIEL